MYGPCFKKHLKETFAQLHQKFHKLLEMYLKQQPTTEEADNALLRYAVVISHICIVLVLYVSGKR